MSKPVQEIPIRTFDGKAGRVLALFDTGSYLTLIRQDCVPAGATITKYKKLETLGTAKKTGKLKIVACMNLVLDVNGHPIRDEVLITPDLKREFILGAKTMQGWDITIKNKNGHTTIHVGRDLNDPDVQAVE